MSARKPHLALSQAAQRDFRNLLAYTEQEWGSEQRRMYRQRFTEAFAELLRFPELGSARPELGQGARAYRVGQHMVIYQASDMEVLIVRILHVRRDFDAELS
jgi:toxin ParE1/3/4